MTLSTSRQQFLAYESQEPEDLQYNRRGGVFVSTCVCIALIIAAVALAAVVGGLVYFISYCKLAQKSQDFWDETEPFGQSSSQSADLRLPSDVVPSFYRLKIKADLENSNFAGDVYITIRASKRVKEIVLHSKNLSINRNVKLMELIYENVTLNARVKRDVSNETETANNETNTIINNVANNETNTINNETNVVVNNDTNETVGNETTILINKETNNTANFANDVTTLPAANVTIETYNEVSNVTDQPNIIEIQTNVLTPDTNTQVTHSSVRNIKIISITEDTGDRLTLTLASALKPNVDYTLELSFEGKITNSLTGFYKSSYVNSQHEVKNLGVTQFEPTSARAAFPCFDEPGFKAKFEISIAHVDGVSVLSNMKVASQETIPEQPGWKWTHFERSVKMSTYLVAYILSDFKSLDTSYLSTDNVTKPIRIWTRPELINKAKYALTITPKLLMFYEQLFGVPYALDKIDLIAIPDFSSGAMENWGLITFRETTLLFDEQDSVPRDKQNVAIDIAHELAHQWFGNLVTMRWWSDLWLNEGFATYVEYVGVDHIEPEWNMFESFSRDKMDLLRSDALKNTSPVSRKVLDASEISQKFDEISYTKGANLIRMLNHTISEELFHNGLVNYLNEWKYENAVESDLWKAMWEASLSSPALKEHSILELMNTWTRQAGYPVISATRDYGSGDVLFEQRLFSSSKSPYKSMVDQLWQIPVSYTGMSAPVGEWSTKPKFWLTERSTTARVAIDKEQALYVNVDAIGYYRVNYDRKNWELLSKALKSGLVHSAITKSQLIDDAFNLAKASQLDYTRALELTTCVMDGEDSKIVWDLLLNNMAFLKYNLRATSGYRYFQDYMNILLRKQLERLNYGLQKPKDDNEAFLIENLVMWECYMESPRCLSWAKAEFDKWASQPDLSHNPIPSYLRSLVYNMALKHGGRREFDILWRVFQNSTDPSVKSLIITNLPSTREESLITMLLEKSLTDIPKQYAVAVWSVEPPVGTALAQQFLLDNFERAHDKFTAMDSFMFPAVLGGAFGLITSQQQLDTFKSFALQHKDKLLPMSQSIQKIVDTATLRIDWVRRYAEAINTWFRNYVTNHSTPAPAETTTAPSATTVTSTIAVPDNDNSTTESINVSPDVPTDSVSKNLS